MVGETRDKKEQIYFLTKKEKYMPRQARLIVPGLPHHIGVKLGSGLTFDICGI